MVTKEDFDDIVKQADTLLVHEVDLGIDEVVGLAIAFNTKSKVAQATPLDFSVGKHKFFYLFGKFMSGISKPEDIILVVQTEAWMASLGDEKEIEEHRNSGIPISERPDRIEVVIISISSMNMEAGICYDLERDENKNIILVNRREQHDKTENNLAEIFFSAFKEKQ